MSQAATTTTLSVAPDSLRAVVAAVDWSVVSAFDVSSGAPLWKNDKLKNRDLSVPFILGHAAVLGDYQGYVHFLSRDDGTLVARVKTDGNPIGAAPVVVGQTLVVQTRGGGVFGYLPK